MNPLRAAYDELRHFFIEKAEATGFPISPIFGHIGRIEDSRALYFEIFDRRALRIRWVTPQPQGEKFEHYISHTELMGQEMPLLAVDLYHWPFHFDWLWEVRDRWIRLRVSEPDINEFLDGSLR